MISMLKKTPDQAARQIFFFFFLTSTPPHTHHHHHTRLPDRFLRFLFRAPLTPYLYFFLFFFFIFLESFPATYGIEPQKKRDRATTKISPHTLPHCPLPRRSQLMAFYVQGKHCKAKFLEAAIHASGVRAGKKESGAFQNLIESKTRSDLSR